MEPGSFRDRNGRVVYTAEGVFRLLSDHALRQWEALSKTLFFQRLMSDGKIVETERVHPEPRALTHGIDGNWAAVLKHRTVPFVSYPYEWCFGMLQDAALLQLELLRAALDEDMILKDASAYNVQWIGTRPIFIDVPSFEEWEAGEPWIGYRQFCQLFLYPLFLQAYKNVSFQPWLRGQIDGIDPEQFNRLMSLRDLARPGVFSHVFLQAKMQARYGSSDKDIRTTMKSVGFHKNLILSNVDRLRKIVRRLSLKPRESEWSDYERFHTYTNEDLERKAAFVRRAVHSRPWNLVWDLGCNTGAFSRIASENARYVVAMDADHLAVERFYQALRSEGREAILPLVMNLSDSSPDLGWRGLERKSIVGRGKPDLTLCLALIHHLVITANIPLPELVDWLAALGTDLVIEFILKEDPMVRTLLRNKADHYDDYDLAVFEGSLSASFEVIEREPLGNGTRILFFARNRVRTG
ncbi:MAG: methyltransferase [Deltaproteobacteria bacterium]|nr:methyltransferase [Deltaproteobacteria bacterium]